MKSRRNASPESSFKERLGRLSARIQQQSGRVLLRQALFVAAVLGFVILAKTLFHGNGFVAAGSFRGVQTAVEEPPATNVPSGATAAPVVAPHFERSNLQRIGAARAFELFHDPRYELSLVVFVDARKDQDYRHGHIPGAYQHDPYHPEKYFATVLRLCLEAEVVIVYCAGGECEDSELATIGLRQAGVADDKLLLFAGGMSEWLAAGYPVETGERLSGILREIVP